MEKRSEYREHSPSLSRLKSESLIRRRILLLKKQRVSGRLFKKKRKQYQKNKRKQGRKKENNNNKKSPPSPPPGLGQCRKNALHGRISGDCPLEVRPAALMPPPAHGHPPNRIHDLLTKRDSSGRRNSLRIFSYLPPPPLPFFSGRRGTYVYISPGVWEGKHVSEMILPRDWGGLTPTTDKNNQEKEEIDIGRQENMQLASMNTFPTVNQIICSSDMDQVRPPSPPALANSVMSSLRGKNIDFIYQWGKGRGWHWTHVTLVFRNKRRKSIL